MMAHLQRRAVEQAIRRFRCCHLNAQAGASEHEMEGEPALLVQGSVALGPALADRAAQELARLR